MRVNAETVTSYFLPCCLDPVSSPEKSTGWMEAVYI